MVHVGMDLVRLYHEYAVRKSRNTSSEKAGEVVDLEESEWMANWRKEMLVNLAFAPLTLHWSLEEGLLGEFWVGILGSVAGISGLRVLWKNTNT